MVLGNESLELERSDRRQKNMLRGGFNGWEVPDGKKIYIYIYIYIMSTVIIDIFQRMNL